jgi:hypothetical protein
MLSPDEHAAFYPSYVNFGVAHLIVIAGAHLVRDLFQALKIAHEMRSCRYI